MEQSSTSRVCCHLSCYYCRYFLNHCVCDRVNLTTELPSLKCSQRRVCLLCGRLTSDLWTTSVLMSAACRSSTSRIGAESAPITRSTSTSLCNFIFITTSSSSLSWKMEGGLRLQIILSLPTARVPAFDLPRRLWVLLNGFRAGQGHCAANHHTSGWLTTRCAHVDSYRQCSTLLMSARRRSSRWSTGPAVGHFIFRLNLSFKPNRNLNA